MSKSCEPKIYKKNKKLKGIKKQKIKKKVFLIDNNHSNYMKIPINNKKRNKTPSILSNNIYTVVNISHIKTDSEKSQFKITPKYLNKSEDKILIKKNKPKTKGYIKNNIKKNSNIRNNRFNKSFDMYKNNLVTKQHYNDYSKNQLKVHFNDLKKNENKKRNNIINNNIERRNIYKEKININSNIAKKITYDEYFENKNSNNSLLGQLKEMKEKLEKSMRETNDK